MHNALRHNIAILPDPTVACAQLEEEYRRKVAAITDREKALSDSVKVEYEAVQRETFGQRQQLLQQTAQLRQRETEIREERDHLARYPECSLAAVWVLLCSPGILSLTFGSTAVSVFSPAF